MRDVVMDRPSVVTIAAVLSWAALNVVSRFLLTRLHIDPWGFSFIQLFAGGIALLAINGRASFGVASLARTSTWILGLLRVLSAAVYTTVLALVSVLETGILGAINMPLIALAVWLLFGRAPARGEWLGYLTIFCSISLLAMDLDSEIRKVALGLMLCNGVCLVSMTLLAEKHPDNLSENPSVRLRFTGTVLLVTAGMFALLRLVQTGFGTEGWDWRLLVSGIVVGVALRAPSMVLTFSSIRLVGAQNYTAATAFLPLIGLAIEQLFVRFGLIEVSRFKFETLLLGLLVAIGTMIVLAARMSSEGAGTSPGWVLFDLIARGAPKLRHLGGARKRKQPTAKPDHKNR